MGQWEITKWLVKSMDYVATGDNMLESLAVTFRHDRVIGLSAWRRYHLNLGSYINFCFSSH